MDGVQVGSEVGDQVMVGSDGTRPVSISHVPEGMHKTHTSQVATSLNNVTKTHITPHCSYSHIEETRQIAPHSNNCLPYIDTKNKEPPSASHYHGDT